MEKTNFQTSSPGEGVVVGTMNQVPQLDAKATKGGRKKAEMP